MYYFITLDNILLFLSTAGINLVDLTEFQKALLFLGGNLFYIVVFAFIINISLKLLFRLIRFVF